MPASTAPCAGAIRRPSSIRRGWSWWPPLPSAWASTSPMSASSPISICPAASRPITGDGRAGRDGLPAETLLLYGMQDVVLRRRFMDENDSPPEVKRVERSKLEALLGLCETVGCRRQACSPISARAGRALRQLRRLPGAGRILGRHGRRPEGAVGGPAHRRAFRRRASRRYPARHGDREDRALRP
jgi:Superfamily II DNA helicase